MIRLATAKLKEILQDKVNHLSVVEPEVAICDNELVVIPEMAISLNEARERLALLQSFVNEMLLPNVDYGIIPNCKKPSLYKSGAEKLCDIFGFSKHFEVIGKQEDWEKKIFHYEIKATLINKRTGFIEAEGLGCCNNKESKYLTKDGYSIINTILKMAKKRAFVDAVLSATRSSGIFTQDMEDLNSTNNIPQSQNTKSKELKPKEALVTKAKTREILSIIKALNLDMNFVQEQMNKRYKIAESKLLTCSQAEDFIKYLKSCRTK